MHFPEEPSCMVARCQNGVCENTYHEHGSWKGEPSFRCRAGIDLVVEFCTDGPGERTFGERPEYTQPIPKAELTVSPNGACGPSSKYTCKDSKWGQCCSEYGYCGSTDAYCSNGCQDNFGLCGPQQVASSSSAKPASSSNVYALKKTTSASSSKVSSTAKKSSSASQSVFTTTQTVTETVRMPVATTVYKTVYNNGTACGNQTNFITSSLPATGSPPSPGASTTSRGLFKKWMKQHDHGHAHGHGR